MAVKSSPPPPEPAADPVEAAAVDAALAAAGMTAGDVLSSRLDAAAGRLSVVTRAGRKLSLPVGGGAG